MDCSAMVDGRAGDKVRFAPVRDHDKAQSTGLCVPPEVLSAVETGRLL